MSRPKDPTRRPQLLKTCFDCFCENGLEATSTKTLAKACGMSPGNLFFHFESKDEIIRDSVALCMANVEDDFMALAPKDLDDIERFFEEMPFITARKHGKKYRFMYQVYASPQYRDCGKEFFEGVNERYHAYAEQLAPNLGLPVELLQGLTYIFVRACVHYALFEDEEYLKLELDALRASLAALTGTPSS